MRVHSIEIENITSLKGKHLVDLKEGLQGEELFAITGSTGAGKSSLLSAISLALYGKTYKGSLASNDFVTTGMPSASVVLEFTLAGKHYTARWSIKVLKKNGEFIKNPKPKRELICEGVALEQVSITDILGLDFDQFCKTIILNQGEFAKFLHSSFKERKDIIEKLYRTGEFSKISKILKEKVKTEEGNLKLLNLSFEKALPYTDEEITAINEDLKAKSKNLKIHEELCSLFEPSYTSLDLLYTKLKEEKTYLDKISMSESKLKKLTNTWNDLKEQYKQIKIKHTKTLENNKIEVPKLRGAIKLSSDLEHAKKVHSSQKKEQASLSTKNKEFSNELTSRIESQKVFEKELEKTRESYHLKTLFLNKTKNEIFGFKEDISKLKNHLSERQRIDGQKEILESQLKLSKETKENFKKELETTKKDIGFDLDEIDHNLQKYRREREANLSLWASFENLSENLATTLKKSEKNNKLKEELIENSKTEESSYQLLLEKEKYNKLSKAILECHSEALSKKSCPVCQNTDLSKLAKPRLDNLITSDAIDSAKEKITQYKYQISQIEEETDEFNSEKKTIIEKLSKSKKIIFKDYDKELHWSSANEVKQGLKVLKELFKAKQKEELSNIDKLSSGKTNIEKIISNYQNAKNNTDLLIKNKEELAILSGQTDALISTFLNNWKGLFKSTLKAEELVSSFEEDMDQFSNEVQLVQKIDSNSESIKKLTSELQEINERLSHLEKDNKRLKQDITSFANELSNICGDKNPIILLESLEREEASASKELQDASDHYNKNEKLKANEEQSLSIFKEQTKEIQNLQKTYIKKLKDQFNKLSDFDGKIAPDYPLYHQSHDLIKESLKWLDFDESQTLNQLLPILEARLESTWAVLMENLKDVSLELKTSVHTNKKRIEEYNAKVEGRSSLEKELKVAKKSLAIKNKLLDAFGKDEFRSYALGLLEAELVRGANLELNDLCDGRYQLRLLPGKGSQMEFFVLDLWRESTLRKINTLSGGETFLVSLAMALALAELTRGQNEIDSFFIDEGFGHLDSESIDDVLEVLMNIQNRGKQIGIISHVKSLTDRIPVNLTLQKSSIGESSTEFRYN